ncbi:MAG TPA: hypothetical protein EYM60_06030 [Candidatus Marinimicrobia bacterium]|nr:hypothetical protein [Candidatus Neomarinimicrobiota bacterium]HIN02881.1 hypothetical protein [Candidatus Neomarinimicrobiota bacterium]
MKTEQKDKSLSSMLLLLSGFLMVYGIGSAGFENPIEWSSFPEYFSHFIDTYLDFILIGYVFICLQVAGYYELKYRQDYLTISLVSILFTPLSLFFIKPHENEPE